MAPALLPHEPRIASVQAADALTRQYLTPNIKALEALLQEVRGRVDSELSASSPFKFGKRYPLSQCLEISKAVHDKLQRLDVTGWSPLAHAGHEALANFLRAGGSMRPIWGALRERYFQNAFVLGTLYVDVANDTVVLTKPKIEILPFDACGITPVRDYFHYARIAQRYWEAHIWPNHVLPELAPLFPLLMLSASGVMELMDRSSYMLALNTRQGFDPARRYLAEGSVPPAVFAEACERLATLQLPTPSSPEDGKRKSLLSVQACRNRHDISGKLMHRLLDACLRANHALARPLRGEPGPVAAMPAPLRFFVQAAPAINVLLIEADPCPLFDGLAPALMHKGHGVTVITQRALQAAAWGPGIRSFSWAAPPSGSDGFKPDVVLAGVPAHECQWVRQTWPTARLGVFCSDIVTASQIEDVDAVLSLGQGPASALAPSLRDKVTVVYEGVDTVRIKPDPHVQLALLRADGTQVVLTRHSEVVTFVSRSLEPRRGFQTLMRALPKLLRERPGLQVLIVGNEGMGKEPPPDPTQYGAATWKEVFVNEVRSRIGDADWERVHFLGTLAHEHVLAVLQLSTVHVHLAHTPGRSRSLMEALSAACVVVASDGPMMREWIEHDQTGRLVNFFDADALTKEVGGLLADAAARQRIGHDARWWARQNLDLHSVCLAQQIQWVEALALRLLQGGQIRTGG